MSTPKIALITDSTCDIPQELVDQYKITIIPQVVVWGEEVYFDREEIKPHEFYHRMDVDPILPTTSQPSPEAFRQVYQTAIDQGAQEIVVYTVSGELSGTFRLAKQVGQEMSVPVHVVDSKGPTFSLGWQVLAAARARESGASALDMIAASEVARKRMSQVVLMDSLEHLQRTGRIGKATQMLGSMIQLKPLIKINHDTGIIESAGYGRTRKKGIQLLEKKFFEQLDCVKPLHIAVLHGNALPEAEQLRQRIQDKYAPVELILNITGPVLGINTGPSALALCGYAEE